MKSFFEDLGKKIGETTETVTSKAGEMMERDWPVRSVSWLRRLQ